MPADVVHREWRALNAAILFLTRLPLPSASTESSWREDLARAPRYFPLVGGFVAGLTGLVFWALAFWLPIPLAAALALALEILLTGAFHDDALADFCDAFGGGTTPERVREILKDSRIGSYGAVALVSGLLVKWTALASLHPAVAIAALTAAGAMGRAAVVVVMNRLPPAPHRDSLSKDVGGGPSATAMGIGVVLALLLSMPAAILLPWQAVAAIAAAAAPALYVGSLMRRVLGGVVGDGLGTIAFTAQALVLVCFAARP